MLKLFCATAFIVTFFSNHLIAQGYQPGFIVEASGDTVKGFIEYKSWDRTPLKISFKKSLELSAVEYDPIQLRSFSVANENYEGAIVDVDVSPHVLGELGNTASPEFQIDTVYLQALVQGIKSLLHLKDRFGKNHFYIKEGQKYMPLVYKRYMVRQTREAIAENQGYKNSLAAYFSDCPSIQNKIKTTRYNVAALTNLFRYYYTCTSQSIKYGTERKEGKAEWGMVGGASLTMINFRGDINYLVDNDYEPSINPTVGFFCDLKLLRSNGWAISNDIMYTSFNIKGEGRRGGNGIPAYTSKPSFHFHYIKSHHLLQINVLKKRIGFVSAGFSTGIAIETDYEIAILNDNGQKTTRPFAPKKFELGLLGGIGFRSGKWSTEARFEFTSGISDYVAVEANAKRVHLLVKYRLK